MVEKTAPPAYFQGKWIIHNLASLPRDHKRCEPWEETLAHFDDLPDITK